MHERRFLDKIDRRGSTEGMVLGALSLALVVVMPDGVMPGGETPDGTPPIAAASRARAVFDPGARADLNAGDARAGSGRRGEHGRSIRAREPWAQIDPDYDAHRREGPIATDTGFVTDASYKDADMVEALLRAYHARFPELTRLEALGVTANGRIIWGLEISDNAAVDEAEPSILLDGAHHGVELMTTEFVIDAVRSLLEGYATDPRMRRYVDSFEIWCVPLVNPDGRQAFMELTRSVGRKTFRDMDGDGTITIGEGVDLNRNYPFRWGALGEVGSSSTPSHPRFRGHAPATEAETLAMMALARRERFVAALSYHTNGTAILVPYATLGVENPEGDESWPVAEDIAAATPIQPNGRRYAVKHRLYPVDGVSKDWLRAELGTLALVIEGPLHNPKDPHLRRSSVESTRATWTALLDRYLDGPALSGVVRAPDGSSLEAEVRIAEIVPRAGETWTSRPRDGLFARYLPRPGRYTVVASAPGYTTARRELDVDGLRTGIELTLEPVRLARMAGE